MFKKDSLVKCINNDVHFKLLTIDKTYMIIRNHEEYIYVIDDIGQENGFDEEHFELVKNQEGK